MAVKRSYIKPKPCSECGSVFHSKWYHNERKPMPPPKNPIPKVGKVGKATASYVDKWKAKQKPNHQGYYTCYISGRKIPYLMAEHPYSKARHPDKRTNQKLEPVAAEINGLKGSLDISDFLKKYPQFKKTVKKEYLKEA